MRLDNSPFIPHDTSMSVATATALNRSQATGRLRQWHAENAALRCEFKSRHVAAIFTARVESVNADTLCLSGPVEIEIRRGFEFAYDETDGLEIWFTPTAMEVPDSIVLRVA